MIDLWGRKRLDLHALPIGKKEMEEENEINCLFVLSVEVLWKETREVEL